MSTSLYEDFGVSYHYTFHFKTPKAQNNTKKF